MHRKQSVVLIILRSCPQSSGTDSDIQSCDWQDNASIFMNMQTSLSSSSSTSIRSLCVYVCVSQGTTLFRHLGDAVFPKESSSQILWDEKPHVLLETRTPTPHHCNLARVQLLLHRLEMFIQDGKTLSAAGRQHLTTHTTHTHTHTPQHLNVLANRKVICGDNSAQQACSQTCLSVKSELRAIKKRATCEQLGAGRT